MSLKAIAYIVYNKCSIIKKKSGPLKYDAHSLNI